ncbi:MAG: gamma-glutamyltransferase family protein [Candidatus Thorarchaeota archaeon]
MPILAENLVVTSQPLACQAGLEMLKNGGNAVDAAIAAAITLTVVEPVNNGIGSDAFAILWNGKELIGLNASGRSPSNWTSELFSRYKAMPQLGWPSVTIPGAVSAWVSLSNKFGKLPFKSLFKPAIKYAENGFLISPIIAEVWKLESQMYKKRKFPVFWSTFMPNDRAPQAGELFKLPYHAKTLKIIAETKGEAFYNGILAKKMVKYAKETGGFFELEDFENHQPIWEKPISIEYKGIKLHEMPPNSQGITALIMLGILKQSKLESYKNDAIGSIHLQIEAMKLAFSDANSYLSDISTMEFHPKYLLKESYLSKRSDLINRTYAQKFEHGFPHNEDTVYLTTADSNGMMVSYIQSNFWGFGSGIVIPSTGISLQNRGCGFSLVKGHPNQVGPNKRPFHTIIPGFVTKKGKPLMSFGVMGGQFQPQGHAQMIVRIYDYRQNPQAALDAPRWRVMQGLNVKVEKDFNEDLINGLTQLGHIVSKSHYFDFGGGQIIFKLDNGYLGASDKRKDGQVVGF